MRGARLSLPSDEERAALSAKALKLFQDGVSTRDIAARFGRNEHTVRQWLQQERERQGVPPIRRTSPRKPTARRVSAAGGAR